jgi:hypothetical protein
VEKFWKMSATEISDQSHLFLGWKAARLNLAYFGVVPSRSEVRCYQVE